MACGLSYGKLLLLCTLISFDWVVHGVRVLPATLEPELHVAEQQAKDVNLIQQKDGCFSDNPWAYTDWTLNIDYDDPVQENVSSCAERCSCALCPGFEYEQSSNMCRLARENWATAWDGLMKFSDHTFYNSDRITYTEDFVFSQNKAIYGHNFETYTGVAMTECADKCRRSTDCSSFEFFNIGVHVGRCQLSKRNSSSAYVGDYNGISFYERRWAVFRGYSTSSDNVRTCTTNCDVMGPWVGMAINNDGDIVLVTRVAYCQLACENQAGCQSFGFKARTSECRDNKECQCRLHSVKRDVGFLPKGAGDWGTGTGTWMWDYYENV